jgi:hypothetical protein
MTENSPLFYKYLTSMSALDRTKIEAARIVQLSILFTRKHRVTT